MIPSLPFLLWLDIYVEPLSMFPPCLVCAKAADVTVIGHSK
jgi:hypothetical protein